MFHAKGTVRSSGSFREWTNGNLQALLEPTESGHRLRLRIVKGDARALIGGGLSALGVTARDRPPDLTPAGTPRAVRPCLR